MLRGDLKKDECLKYLVAIDGSLNASACIQMLCNVPIANDSLIHVISIWDDEPVFVAHRINRQRAESLVDEAVHQLKVVYGDGVTGEALSGNVIAKILQTSESFDAHTILLGAHSRRGWNDILLGNVTNEVLRKSRSSVVIVRVNPQGKFVPQKRHLICIDASLMTQRILRTLENRRWTQGSELRILHVLELDTVAESEDPKRDAELCFRRLIDERSRMQQLIDAYLATIKRAFPEIVVTGQILEEIDTVEGILDTAKSWNADSILLGSHGRTGLERICLGSTSEDVSARAACTVEIIR
jgi:nucleotide-binding universal stress UspA family protein